MRDRPPPRSRDPATGMETMLPETPRDSRVQDALTQEPPERLAVHLTWVRLWARASQPQGSLGLGWPCRRARSQATPGHAPSLLGNCTLGSGGWEWRGMSTSQQTARDRARLAARRGSSQERGQRPSREAGLEAASPGNQLAQSSPEEAHQA